MKKLLSVLCVSFLCVTLFSGCISLGLLGNNLYKEEKPLGAVIATQRPTPVFATPEIILEATPEPTPVPTPEPTKKPSTVLSYSQAKNAARKYWEMADDTDVLDDGTKIAIFSSEDDYVVSGGVKYYHFFLKWLVLDEDGSPSHYSTIDSVYVNTVTGECSYSINGN